MVLQWAWMLISLIEKQTCVAEGLFPSIFNSTSAKVNLAELKLC